MAARTRLIVLVGALAMLLPACSYDRSEPGLFPSPPTRSSDAPPPRTRFPPQQTNPELPVVGEAIWVSGGRLPVTFRLAVHAVRRAQGATVMDWSVTPIEADGHDFGDDLPGIDLALDRASRSDINFTLLDPATGEVYLPLTHRSRGLFNHCLCTPPWVIQQDLRIGETRLLQIAFPELAAGVEFIDVSLATVPPFVHVPVTERGSVPTFTAPTDLARSAGDVATISKRITVRYRDPSRGTQTLQINQVLAAPGRTSVEWTITSVADQDITQLQNWGPPISNVPADDLYIVTNNPASGPVLLVGRGSGRQRLHASWVVTETNGQPGYECLCTDVGLWANALRRAGGTVRVTTNYPALPPDLARLDIELPGFGAFRDVPVRPAPDSASRSGPVRRGPDPVPLWSYRVEDPPRGWATADWPTPEPDPAQLADYRFVIEQVVRLPGE